MEGGKTAEHISSPVKHLGGSVRIAACMAASGPGSVGSTDVTDNGSQMNSDAHREILSVRSHIIRRSPLGRKGGMCGPCQLNKLKIHSVGGCVSMELYFTNNHINGSFRQ